VKPAPFLYERPETIAEALATLAEHGDEAKLLAGGQSLLPLLNMRFARPAVLVDLNRVRDLDRLGEVNNVVRAGALVRQSAFGASPLVRERVPLAADCIPYVGHFVTRNRGTVGGSIAHADARAELPLALTAAGGRVVIHSPGGGFRAAPAETFFVTHFTTVLRPTELVAETTWPAAGPGSGFAFEELALRRGDYAIAMAACSLRIEEGRAADTRVAVGAVTDRPLLLAGVSALVNGEEIAPELAREAGAAAAGAVDPADTLHASAAYQRHLTALLVERALLRAWDRAVASASRPW
jgi:carbon-monoxide dehydrogenase medium subunit